MLSNQPKKQEKVANSKIGLSLSFCISAILRGEIDESEVLAIVSATKATNEEEWKKLIDGYKESYWYDNPEKAEKIVKRLLKEGKIVQPRNELSPEKFHSHNIARGNWIANDELETWLSDQEINGNIDEEYARNTRELLDGILK